MVGVFGSSRGSNPAVLPYLSSEFSDKPHYSEPAYGYHQVVVLPPNHNRPYLKFLLNQWANVLLVVSSRVRWLYSQKSVTYVSIFVNSGVGAGGSIFDPYFNMVTF